MKNIIFLLLLFYTTFTFADPIEDFTFEDATRIVEYLKKNPFMIDYCDCCNNVRSQGEAPIQAKLIRIVERKVIPCEYNHERYSIRITAKILATGIVKNQQMTNLTIIPRNVKETYITLLSANYFFCARNSKIGQLGMITQDDKLYKEYNCGGINSFPGPGEPSIFGNKYMLWFRKNAREPM